jgi:hypothetical protein
MFFGGILARLRMLLTSGLTNRLASSSSGKIPSSTEAMISAVGILLGTTENFRPCSRPFLSNSLSSLDERFLTHLFLRFELDLSDGFVPIRRSHFFFNHNIF